MWYNSIAMNKTREEVNKYHADWGRTHRERVKRTLAKCYQKHAEKRRQYAREYTQKNLANIIEKRQQIKRDVLAHYGNGKLACVKCGENRLACLSADHINGEGNTHRRLVGKGNMVYRWLKKNNYPDGYQTLCMNCQFIKSIK